MASLKRPLANSVSVRRAWLDSPAAARKTPNLALLPDGLLLLVGRQGAVKLLECRRSWLLADQGGGVAPRGGEGSGPAADGGLGWIRLAVTTMVLLSVGWLPLHLTTSDHSAHHHHLHSAHHHHSYKIPRCDQKSSTYILMVM